MLLFLLDRLPKDIIAEIAIFEGRITRAYLQDYIGQLYSRVYKQYFGYRHSLKYITDACISLPFYSAWSTVIRVKHPEFVKDRFPHLHMREYVGIVPEVRLRKERINIEARLSHFFTNRRRVLQPNSGELEINLNPNNTNVLIF